MFVAAAAAEEEPAEEEQPAEEEKPTEEEKPAPAKDTSSDGR